MNILIHREMSLEGSSPVQVTNIDVNILHPEIRRAIEEEFPNTETVYLSGFGPTYIFVYTGGKHPHTYSRITIEI